MAWGHVRRPFEPAAGAAGGLPAAGARRRGHFFWAFWGYQIGSIRSMRTAGAAYAAPGSLPSASVAVPVGHSVALTNQARQPANYA